MYLTREKQNYKDVKRIGYEFTSYVRCFCIGIEILTQNNSNFIYIICVTDDMMKETDPTDLVAAVTVLGVVVVLAIVAMIALALCFR